MQFNAKEDASRKYSSLLFGGTVTRTCSITYELSHGHTVLPVSHSTDMQACSISQKNVYSASSRLILNLLKIEEAFYV